MTKNFFLFNRCNGLHCEQLTVSNPAIQITVRETINLKSLHFRVKKKNCFGGWKK